METFYQSFLTPDIQICGYELNDFSYNHLCILRALNSPFVDTSSQQNINAAELIIALKVCSTSYPEKGFTLTKKDRFKAFLMGRDTQNLFVNCNNFSVYIAEHQKVPQFWEFESKGGWSASSSPDELSTVALLVKNNIPHNEAWNMSIGYANWLCATLLEQSGNPRVFVDPQELPTGEESLNDKTDAELYEITKKHLGKERADKWLKAREANNGN